MTSPKTKTSAFFTPQGGVCCELARILEDTRKMETESVDHRFFCTIPSARSEEQMAHQRKFFYIAPQHNTQSPFI